MASKGKGNVRIESEIERSREESDWKRLIELAEQLKTRSPNHGNVFIVRKAQFILSYNLNVIFAHVSVYLPCFCFGNFRIVVSMTETLLLLLLWWNQRL